MHAEEISIKLQIFDIGSCNKDSIIKKCYKKIHKKIVIKKVLKSTTAIKIFISINVNVNFAKSVLIFF